VDKRLAGYIAEQYKPCILVVNKWDLAKGRATSDDYGEYLLKTLPGLDYAPVAFTTANQGRNVQAVIDLASSLFKQSRTRVTTAELNAAIETATSENVPKPKHGVGKLKIYYGTQVAVEPPTIVLFVNDPTRVSQTYERFLTRRLHELLPYPEVPIRIMYRGRRVGEPTADRPGQGKARPESSPRKRKPAQPRRASQSTKTGKKEDRRR
jgi:GTP-binding protein